MLIDDPRKWRISKSGYLIVTDEPEARWVAAYPGRMEHPFNPEAHKQWLKDAEKICDLYNATLEDKDGD